MSQSIPTGYIPPSNPWGFAQRNCPGGRDLTVESCPGDWEFDKGQDFVESSNHAKRHINVCSGGDLCSPFFNNFSETHCIKKVGLDVRISLVRVLSTEREEEAPPSPKKKVFPEKKIKSYFIY